MTVAASLDPARFSRSTSLRPPVTPAPASSPRSRHHGGDLAALQDALRGEPDDHHPEGLLAMREDAAPHDLRPSLRSRGDCPVRPASSTPDKVCATLTLDGGRPSRREKDLVDLVVLAATQGDDATKLQSALRKASAYDVPGCERAGALSRWAASAVALIGCPRR